MLRDEDNAKYRSVIKNTLEFDPDIMKRYVNFMSNPDERTAIDQFGKGDKCFGVAAMMSTLPGLPMFGHGQIEGFTEKYGMEYRWPRYEEIARPLACRAPRTRDRAAAQAPLAVCREQQLPALRLLHRQRLGRRERLRLLQPQRRRARAGHLQQPLRRHARHHRFLRRLCRQGFGPASPAAPARRARPQRRSATPSLPCATRSPAWNICAAPAILLDRGLTLELHAYQCHVFLDWRELRSTAAATLGSALRLAQRPRRSQP